MTPEASRETVGLEEVRHVAELANLELTAEELPAMAHSLNAVLSYVAQLQELDTDTIAAMAQPAEMLEGGAVDSSGGALRADSVRPSVVRAEVMAEAPESDGRFFKVPKVIER